MSLIQYSVNKNIIIIIYNIIYKIKYSLILGSNLCDYSDAYVVVKGITTAKGTNNVNRRNKKLTFKNDAAFRLCISKINNTFIDNADNLDIVMSMDIC